MKDKKRFILKMLLKYSRYSLVILLIGTINTGLMLAMPYFNAKMIDEGIMAGDLKIFTMFLVVYLIIYFVGLFVKTTLAMASTKYSNLVKKDFVIAVTNHLLEESDDAITRGKAHNVISKEINLLQNCLFSLPVGIAGSIINFFLSLAFLWYFTKYFTIPIIIICLMSIFLRNKMNGFLQKHNTILYKAILQLNTKQMEFLDYFKSAKLIHAVNYMRNRLVNDYDNYIATEYNAFKMIQKVTVLSGINDQFLTTGILFFTGYQVIKKKMSLGMMFSIGKYSSQLLASITQFLSHISFLYTNKCELENVIVILSAAGTKSAVATTKQAVNCDEIHINQVFYHYPDGHGIFENVNQVFTKGKINFITGSSGVGKTTLFKLLTREIRPVKGKISAAFEDIYMVPQIAIIFNDTITNNIILDLPFDKDKLDFVCNKCQIYEEIIAMPLEYETIISDQATNISAGQKQRICLARALYNDKLILILDEPTANIDGLKSQSIIDFLTEYAINHLVIVITHSNNLITRDSNKFIILNCKIVEEIL